MNARMILALALLATGSLPAAAKVTVVTSSTDLADIARAVGGDRVDVSSIAAGTQDLHFIDAKPSFMLQARSADLFVEVGMEMDQAWVGSIVEGSRNQKIAPGKPGRLDASASVLKLEVPSGTVDRSQGDVHALGNPHYWLDPWNVRIVADEMAERLGQLDPAGAAAYAQGASAFKRRVDEAMFGRPLVDALGAEAAWKLALAPEFPGNLPSASPPLGGWAGSLAPYRGERVFTHHRSWSYLLSRFGLVSAGQIEPKPGIPPTPGHLVELVGIAKAKPVKAILVEPFYNDQAAKLVAGQIGASVLRLPLSSGGDAESKDWFALMDHVVASVAGAFAGRG